MKDERISIYERLEHYKNQYGVYDKKSPMDKRLDCYEAARNQSIDEHLEEVHKMLYAVCDKLDIEVDLE